MYPAREAKQDGRRSALGLGWAGIPHEDLMQVCVFESFPGGNLFHYLFAREVSHASIAHPPQAGLLRESLCRSVCTLLPPP